MSNIDIKLKSYDELQFEVMTLTTNSYLKDLKIKELEAKINLLEDNRIFLNNKIDKAIEYIETDIEYNGIAMVTVKTYDKLLDILKGGNNE